MKILGQTSAGKVFPVQVDDDGQLQIDLKAIAAGSNLIGRVDARDGDKIWSYQETYSEAVEIESATAGLNGLQGADLSSGEVLVVTACAIRDTTNAPSRMTLYAVVNSNTIPLEENTAPAANEWLVWTGEVTLAQGDNMRGIISGATAGDLLQFRYTGYKMQV